MIEVESRVREWGNSIGIVIPKDAAMQDRIAAGDTVKILILKRTDTLKDTFGRVHLKRSTDQMLREVDEEAWNE